MTKSDKTRREFLKTMGLGAAAATALGRGALAATAPEGSTMPKKKRPNVLFICTDYQAGEDGPSLGAPFLDMPAMDRLCREGAVLLNHYSTAPICVPARYTWVTGQYPHIHGAYDNNGKFPDDGPVLMRLLREEGYNTVGVGKMHFNPMKHEAGFDRRIIADQKEAGWNRDDFGAGA